MSIRKRDDSVKPGCGIDGTKGENFTRGAVGSWNQQSNHSERESYSGAYGTNDSGLRNQRDVQFRWETRDIYTDVVDNDGGSANGGFSGPIKAGVNRSQGKKY
jgi:hypothetical protein